MSNKAYGTDDVCHLQHKRAMTVNRGYTAVACERYGIITLVSRANKPH